MGSRNRRAGRSGAHGGRDPRGRGRLVDAWSIARSGVAPQPTFCVHDPGYLGGPATFDFCFVSENLAPRVAALDVDGACDASDHQPVLLTLS